MTCPLRNFIFLPLVTLTHTQGSSDKIFCLLFTQQMAVIYGTGVPQGYRRIRQVS